VIEKKLKAAEPS